MWPCHVETAMSAFPPNLLEGEHYAVCGLGRNGRAVVQALLGMGATVQAWDDSNPEMPAQDGLTLAPLTDLQGATALILSPGIPHALPNPHPAAALAKAQAVPIFSDAEILYRAVRRAGSSAKFVSVTGTNGKSTTTSLIAHLLIQSGRNCEIGGNFGTASLALPLLPDDGIYVIEMSSYMLERLETFHATAACLLNLTPDHLDRHGDMAGYAAAKAHVFDNMEPPDLAVIGTDDPWCRQIVADVKSTGVSVIEIDADSVANFDAAALPGRHNRQNIAAAWAIARYLGLSDDAALAGLRSFAGLEHRLQKISESEGISFINDSKATNAEAASKALASYDKVMWLAGGVAKAGGIESLAPWFHHISTAFLIGRDAEILASTLKAHNVPHVICGTLDIAVERAFDAARAKSVSTVLLSPACASFDQFKSFEDRGSQFGNICDNIAKSNRSTQTLITPGEN